MHTARPISLKKNVLLTIGGNMFYAASQWLLLVVLAKFGDTSSVGVFSLAMAINTPVLVLTKLQLRAIQVTDAKEEYAFGQYARLRAYCALLTFGIVAPIALFAADSPRMVAVILVLTLAKAIEMVSDIYYGLLQKKERMDLISLSLVVKGASSVGAFALLLWITDDLLWGSAALAVVWGLLLVFMDMRLARRVTRGESWSRRSGKGNVRSLLWLALPMGIAGVLNAVAGNIPRYVIQYDLNEFALGIFSGIAYLIVAGDTVVGAFGQAVSPRLANYYAANQIGPFVKLIGRTVMLALAVGAAGILVALAGGRYILPFLYNADYAGYTGLFVWVMVAGAATYAVNVLGVGVTAMRRFNIQIPIHVLANVLILVLCPLLLRQFGLTGVAYAMTIDSVVIALVFAAVLWRSIVAMRKRVRAERRNPVNEVLL